VDTFDEAGNMNITTQPGDDIVTQQGPALVALDPLFGISIESLRSRAGLPQSDVSKDALINEAFSSAIGVLETYLNRILRFGNYTETFVHFAGKVAPLKAYPIDRVMVVICATGFEPSYHIDRVVGDLHMDTFVRAHELSVSYSGGYRAFPSDLALAAIMTFDNVWAALNSSAGAVSGAGEIKSISVPDVGTISYQSAGAASGGKAGLGYIPGTVIDVLSKYRRELA
jgi:hypothetical protein